MTRPGLSETRCAKQHEYQQAAFRRIVFNANVISMPKTTASRFEAARSAIHFRVAAYDQHVKFAGFEIFALQKRAHLQER